MFEQEGDLETSKESGEITVSPQDTLAAISAYRSFSRVFPGATSAQIDRYIDATQQVCRALVEGRPLRELPSTIIVPAHLVFGMMAKYYRNIVAAEASGFGRDSGGRIF